MYFQSRATQRHHKNTISNIYDSSGQWCLNSIDAVTIALNYYLILFFLEPIRQPKEIVSSIHSIITAKMNDQLSTQFLAWKVQKAINQMAPLKAPGLDGIPPIFFQNYWNLIGNDITQSILQFLNTASLPPHLNHNFVNLILKVKCPESVSEYRCHQFM